LRIGEIVEADRWDFAHTQPLGGLQASVPGDDIAEAVDQDRNIEAELANALSNLLDVFRGVPSCVFRIWLEFRNVLVVIVSALS